MNRQAPGGTVAVPGFLLRRLYRRGSLQRIGAGRFSFVLQNPLASATLVAPPVIVVNGVRHPPEDVQTDWVDLAGLSRSRPFVFQKGAAVELRFRGHLLRGGNRIHLEVVTKEWGRVSFLVEDRDRYGDEEE